MKVSEVGWLYLKQKNISQSIPFGNVCLKDKLPLIPPAI